MRRALAISLAVTDLLFLAYWSTSLLALAGVVHVSPDAMYAGYDQPRVIAWNWSFLPLDLAFSVSGLLAVRAARRGSPIWRPLALISLAFTVAAGGMAIGYWTLLGEFNPSWFLPNLALVVWPMAFLPGLIRETASPPA
ncbi:MULTISPECIES: DUF5360 family protein [Phenylobacterium]|jgi:hypothetical protein|uniref:DUF5360 family protein n=1 Tax=Phenylobacterium conjunctum TaxID=1298959 RepID=A0ABW3SWH0_9CAUL